MDRLPLRLYVAGTLALCLSPGCGDDSANEFPSDGASQDGGAGDSGPADGASSAGDAAQPQATRQCSTVTSGTFEFYGQPATTGLASGLSFRSDFGQNPLAGGFVGRQAVDDCRMRLDGFTTSHGLPALRVEVNPGDDPLDLGTERAELLTMQDASGNDFSTEGQSGATLFYATSYYFPASWDGTFLSGDSESWSFVNQFYGWGALAAGRRTAGGPQIYWFSGGDPGTFSDGGLISLGQWTDFVFRVDWATGGFVVYRREEGQVKFVEVLNDTSPDAQNCTYYKQGLYRGPHVNGRTDVLWIGPTSRGTSFSAVEQASFGTDEGF